MTEPLILSLEVSLAATALAAAIGTLVAWALAKRRFPGRALAEGLTILPLVLPPTVLGYYLLVLLSANSVLGRIYRAVTGHDMVFEFSGIVIAACIAAIPLYLRQAQVAFQEVDSELEDAARTAGATE